MMKGLKSKTTNVLKVKLSKGADIQKQDRIGWLLLNFQFDL